MFYWFVVLNVNFTKITENFIRGVTLKYINLHVNLRHDQNCSFRRRTLLLVSKQKKLTAGCLTF